MASKTMVFKSAGVEAAKIAGRSPEMDAVKDALVAKAKANAAGHGSLPAAIHGETVRGKRGVQDREAVLEHEAASHIELGHVGPGGTWVKGLHVMWKASREV